MSKETLSQSLLALEYSQTAPKSDLPAVMALFLQKLQEANFYTVPGESRLKKRRQQAIADSQHSRRLKRQ